MAFSVCKIFCDGTYLEPRQKEIGVQGKRRLIIQGNGAHLTKILCTPMKLSKEKEVSLMKHIVHPLKVCS